MEYLILWFDIFGQIVATNCSYKDLKKGTVKLELYDDRTKAYYSIGRYSIKSCYHISKFRYLNSNKKFIRWEDKDKLFKKYPELKKLVA